MLYTDYVKFHTRGHADMHDLTDQVRHVLAQSNVTDGTVTIFTPSATSSLTTIEFETGALQDLARALDEIAPADREYKHNLRWGDGNGHAHLRAALLGPSLHVPVVNGRMTLGTWQQILFIDFDVRPRDRSVVVQIMGEAR